MIRQIPMKPLLNPGWVYTDEDRKYKYSVFYYNKKSGTSLEYAEMGNIEDKGVAKRGVYRGNKLTGGYFI